MSQILKNLPGRARVLHSPNGNSTLYIDANEVEACVDLWNSGCYTQLGVAEVENPGLDSLYCLEFFHGISRLHINLGRSVDVSILNKRAAELKAYFCNDDLNPLTDLRGFFVLEELGQKWSKSTRFDLNYKNLTRVALLGYSNDVDQKVLPFSAENLRTISFVNARLRSMKGLDSFARLNIFSLTSPREMLDFGESGLHFLELKEFCIDGGAKYVGDISEYLKYLVTLEKIELMRSHPLAHVRFIERMPNLKWLNLMDTNVIDGDMSYLLRHPSLEYAVFTSKKHFSHTEAQVRAALQAKKEGMK